MFKYVFDHFDPSPGAVFADGRETPVQISGLWEKTWARARHGPWSWAEVYPGIHLLSYMYICMNVCMNIYI